MATFEGSSSTAPFLLNVCSTNGLHVEWGERLSRDGVLPQTAYVSTRVEVRKIGRNEEEEENGEQMVARNGKQRAKEAR